MRKVIFLIISVFVLVSCEEESTIQVKNMLSKAVIKNVEWGGLPISSQILPGQSSGKITVFEDESYYDINLPESNPIKFYIDLNGDLIYVQTKASYRLDVDDDLIIVIEDSTAVFNPLLEKEK
ncbi:MAG: hypothetical protein ABFC90_03400 [Bacteroidales bacterium]|nr:hypothetical protein [Bacteroidales bacterium]MDD2612051.1 hypothetical protein [Bacteroidales bacterium]MDD4712856.1 hypothetical protein [Bacteroidales bacterium]